MGVIGSNYCRLGALLLVKVLVLMTVLIKIVVVCGLHLSTLLRDLPGLQIMLRFALVFPVGLHMVHFPERMLLVVWRIRLRRLQFGRLLLRVTQLLAFLFVSRVRLRSVLISHELLHLRLPLILVGRNMSRHSLLLHLGLISVD